MVQSENVELSSATEQDLSAKKPCLRINANLNLSSKAGKRYTFFSTGEIRSGEVVFH